ncbi:MAG: ATP-binding cassette domain-containing protein [Pseudomonadota bacterium]
MSKLEVDISAKMFGAQKVLGEIRFEIPAGQRVALLGVSGVGKSTLLSLISGTETAFEGRILRPSWRIAMVFQTPRLLPWRTLAQNIALVPDAGGLARARELLSAVGLADAADQFPEKVSLGMQRRAALARALAVDPDLILMDEPLVSLDAASAAEMRRLLTETLDRTGAAALIATHDRREALALADRVLMLDGPPGRLAEDRQSPLDRAERGDPNAVSSLHMDWFGADV